MSEVGRARSRNPDETFPAWPGVQCSARTSSGRAQRRHIDDDRCGPHAGTTVRDVLQAHLAGRAGPPA